MTTGPRPGHRPGGRPHPSASGLLVHYVAQSDGRVLDIAVLHPPGPYLGGEQPAAVYPREVAVREFVPGLGVLGRLVIDAEVPVSVFIPAVGFDELVLLTR